MPACRRVASTGEIVYKYISFDNFLTMNVAVRVVPQFKYSVVWMLRVCEDAGEVRGMDVGKVGCQKVIMRPRWVDVDF